MTLPEKIATVSEAAQNVAVHLKVLATTDLHAHLLPYDYFTDRPDRTVGLAQVGELITILRAGSDNIVLLDNGDTLQGAPLADAAVAEIVPSGRLHPMIAAMNALGYDAATLGNHDFDFGIRHLEASLAGAVFPFVSANAHYVSGDPVVLPRCLLTREVTDEAGGKHTLHIGVTGAVPPQVAQWNKPHLQGCMVFEDIISAVRTEVNALRAEGADIVLVLAHSGCGSLDAGPGAENVAFLVSQIEGVDGVVAGHTHKVRAEAMPDARAAPIVQPGAFGSHLGCVDFTLEQHARDDDGTSPPQWRVRQANASNYSMAEQRALRAISSDDVPSSSPIIQDVIAKEHQATRAFVSQPLGESHVPLETYFSVLAPCAATQLVADAQLAAATPLIASVPSLAGLPILSAVAPFKAGGRSGPRSYTDVPAGPLRLRHAADLYLYPNMLSVLRITGRGVVEWLERSASLFRQITPGASTPQELIDHEFAPYNFDRIVGLRYQIDVSRPARTNAEGDDICDTPGRIRGLTLADGTPVTPEDEVLVITNSYRAAGGGHMKAAQAADEVIAAQFAVRDAVSRHISETSSPINPVVEPTFSLAPLSETEVVVETGPGALLHTSRVAALGLSPLDVGENGFQRFSMTL